MRPSNQRGNILISVLWVIVTMAIIVLGLSYESRSDMERTRMMRDRARAYWLARAAVERVKYDYAALRQSQNEEDVLVTRYQYDFENGSAEAVVRSNSSLMSVNSTNRELWLQLLKLYVEDESERDMIVDAILDWRDQDDLTRLNGCETDYYMSLTPPYPARNGAFYSVEEIMLVRGITEAMFYGSWDKPGMIEMLDLNRQNLSRFDINTCPKGILMAFLEMTSEEADELIALRREQYFGNINDVATAVTVNNEENLQKFFMSFRGSTFTIKATAYVDGSPARYTVEDTVSYKGGGTFYRNLSHKDFSLEHVDEMDQLDNEETDL
ncbi:MAG: type II secretion system protein GspK [Acidobacteriota bacterium]|nr:type II secretion system protein GspK [Acidobacteriota bacterium]